MSENKKEDKIIPFPGSAQQLVKLGMKQLKYGDNKAAYYSFREALFHDPIHDEASYGLLLAYADSGRLYEGKDWAERMLNEARGDYFEVLQVYVSILAQLEEYERVTTVLEAVLEEDQFPSHMAEKLYELLELSQYMSHAEMEAFMPDEKKAAVLHSTNWKKQLQNGTTEQRLSALRELRNQKPESVLPAIESLLADPEFSPLMQSFLLLLLKDWQIEKQVWVNKLSRKGEFSPVSLPVIEESNSYIQPAQLLESKLEQENPILLKNALHLMKQLYLYYYPFPPSLEMEALAAVMHYEAAEQAGSNDKSMNFAQIAKDYNAEEACIFDVWQKFARIKIKMFDI